LTHNLENDAAELKVMMVRVLESNAELTERMSILEKAQKNPFNFWEDREFPSVLDEQTVTSLNNEVSDTLTLGTLQHHPAMNAFEEDLSKSWVYQRSLVRGPRTFSIATSKRLT
jgi:hypothetical protein